MDFLWSIFCCLTISASASIFIYIEKKIVSCVVSVKQISDSEIMCAWYDNNAKMVSIGTFWQRLLLYHQLYNFKGTVQPQINILSWSTHPNADIKSDEIFYRPHNISGILQLNSIAPFSVTGVDREKNILNGSIQLVSRSPEMMNWFENKFFFTLQCQFCGLQNFNWLSI